MTLFRFPKASDSLPQNLATMVQPIPVHRVTFRAQLPGLVPPTKRRLANGEHLGGRLNRQPLALFARVRTQPQNLVNLDHRHEPFA